MPRVPHDFFIENAVTISGRHKASAEAVRAEGLLPLTSQAGFVCPLQEDLSDTIGIEAAFLHLAAAVHFAKQRARFDLGGRQPGPQSRDRACFWRTPAGDRDLRPFSNFIRFGTGNEDRYAPSCPGQMLDIDPDKF